MPRAPKCIVGHGVRPLCRRDGSLRLSAGRAKVLRMASSVYPEDPTTTSSPSWTVPRLAIPRLPTLGFAGKRDDVGRAYRFEVWTAREMVDFAVFIPADLSNPA